LSFLTQSCCHFGLHFFKSGLFLLFFKLLIG
jgi:hypothetical protein